jgi:hypothetical protein
MLVLRSNSETPTVKTNTSYFRKHYGNTIAVEAKWTARAPISASGMTVVVYASPWGYCPTRKVKLASVVWVSTVENVDLFRRFDVMKLWRDADHMDFESFVSPDGLHMNDWSYACMAKGLGLVIAEAAERPVMAAKATSHLVP